MSNAVHAVVARPVEEFRRGGTGAFASAAVRGLPTAVIQPLIGVTSGMGRMLIGIRNSVDPLRHVADHAKFKPGKP